MKIFLVSLSLVVGVTLTLLADVALKKSDFSSIKWLLVGLVIYGSVAVPVALLFKLVQFGNLFILWEAAYLILGIAVASLFYNEPFTIYRFLAVLLALGALFLSYK